MGGPAAPDGGLRIDVAAGPAGPRLVFVGDLDLAGVAAADAAIRDAMAGPGEVTIDLTRLEFIGSEGIRVVLRARERADAEGRGLRVAAGDGPARRLIDILGLAERLGVDGDPR
ncbi:MAG: STAS domain-containing protein [Thermoleophilia bacterium]